jgi:hypothetical protein
MGGSGPYFLDEVIHPKYLDRRVKFFCLVGWTRSNGDQTY